MTDTSVGDIVRAWKQRADLENLRYRTGVNRKRERVLCAGFGEK